MKMPVVALVALTAGALGGTFVAGALVGGFIELRHMNSKLDEFCGIVRPGTNARNSILMFNKHEAAITALSRGDVKEVDEILHYLAGVDANQIEDCKRDLDCLRVIGNPLPDQSALDKEIFRNLEQIRR